MANVKIGSPNWLDQNAFPFNLGSWKASGNPFQMANMVSRDFARTARSTDAATTSTQFGIDLSAYASTYFGNPIGADAFFIPKHNLTQSATIRVKAGSAAFTAGGAGGGTVSYDSGVINALQQIIYPPGIVAWGHVSGWSGAPDPLMDNAYNRGVIVQFGQTIVASYWWIGLDDHTNAAGYVELTGLFLGPLYQPTINFAYGTSVSFSGELVSDKALSGVEYVSEQLLRRVATIQWKDLGLDEANAIVTGLQMYIGFHRQVLFVFDPDDTYQMPRRAFLAMARKPAVLPYNAFGTNDVAMELAEVI